MSEKHKILGIIPARGGSKGVPDKNIRTLNGRPLIYYTILAARQSALLTEFVVSTESEKIAGICREYGAELPFMRPAELALDHMESYPVIRHALEEMVRINEGKYDYFVMLQPTTPLRTAQDIDESLNILIRTDADSVVSVVDVGGTHPLRMKRIVDDNILINYIDQGFENMKPRQELPPVYIRNGAIYASKCSVLQDFDALVGEDCRAYVMPQDRSINIDTMVDFIVADYMVQADRYR